MTQVIEDLPYKYWVQTLVPTKKKASKQKRKSKKGESASLKEIIFLIRAKRKYALD
jgi:hypothetical protein